MKLEVQKLWWIKVYRFDKYESLINSAKRIRIVWNLRDQSFKSFLKILEREKIETEYFHVCISRFSVITKSDGSVFFFFFNLQLLKKANIFYYFMDQSVRTRNWSCSLINYYIQAEIKLKYSGYNKIYNTNHY